MRHFENNWKVRNALFILSRKHRQTSDGQMTLNETFSLICICHDVVKVIRLRSQNIVHWPSEQNFPQKTEKHTYKLFELAQKKLKWNEMILSIRGRPYGIASLDTFSSNLTFFRSFIKELAHVFLNSLSCIHFRLYLQ